MPRLRKPPKEKEQLQIIPDAEPPTEPISIEIEDDSDLPVQIDLAPEPREEEPPKPQIIPPAQAEDDPVKRALEATQRAEQLQRELAEQRRQADELRRQAQERDQELARQRADAEDAQYNSVLTAIAAEQAALDKAKADYAQAMGNGDFNAAAEAQTVMARASARIDRLDDNKSSFEVRREEQKKAPPQSQRGAPSFEDRIAQLPDEAKTWLRAHPEFINDQAKNNQITAAHGYLTQIKKVEPFSKAYFEALDTEFGFKTEAPQAHNPPPVTPASPPRRSIPVSAPVSRDGPTLSGAKPKRTVDLTPEERDIARRSYTAPDMDDATKERLYAMNKLKLQQQRANGQYPERERN